MKKLKMILTLTFVIIYSASISMPVSSEAKEVELHDIGEVMVTTALTAPVTTVAATTTINPDEYTGSIRFVPPIPEYYQLNLYSKYYKDGELVKDEYGEDITIFAKDNISIEAETENESIVRISEILEIENKPYSAGRPYAVNNSYDKEFSINVVPLKAGDTKLKITASDGFAIEMNIKVEDNYYEIQPISDPPVTHEKGEETLKLFKYFGLDGELEYCEEPLYDYINYFYTWRNPKHENRYCYIDLALKDHSVNPVIEIADDSIIKFLGTSAISKLNSGSLPEWKYSTKIFLQPLKGGETTIKIKDDNGYSVEKKIIVDDNYDPAIPNGFVTTTTEICTTRTNSATSSKTNTTTTAVKLKTGDANVDGKVSAADAVAILQYLGNNDKYSLSDEGRANADVYNPGDGITPMDALAIQKLDAGVIKSLPEIAK